MNLMYLGVYSEMNQSGQKMTTAVFTAQDRLFIRKNDPN